MTLIAFCILPMLGAYAGAIQKNYNPTNANCVDYEVPVAVSTRGLSWIAPKWTDNLGYTDFISESATRMSANLSAPVSGPVALNGSFSISATFCSPKTENDTSSTVLVLTHGGGYDRRYWNSGFQPETYNFVQFAISQGYSVFFYDRLGTGQSSNTSGFVNQASIQIQILAELATKIKAGNYTDSLGVPKKLVLVGHSFGSFVSNGLLAGAPSIADAAILTGLSFSQNGGVEIEAFGLRVASQLDKKWQGLDTGYLIWASIYSNVNVFFKAPTYDIQAVQYTETVKAPIAITELLSIASIPYATQFKGPTLVLNGEYDFLVCSGYCPGVNEQPVGTYFNSSSAFKAEIVPNTGHGLNFHKNALQTYATITNFLKDNGL